MHVGSGRTFAQLPNLALGSKHHIHKCVEATCQLEEPVIYVAEACAIAPVWLWTCW